MEFEPVLDIDPMDRLKMNLRQTGIL
jgi:hypothetical protein